MLKLTGKVQKLPNRNGFSYQLKIVHYHRDEKGTPTNKLIKNIITIPAAKLNDYLYGVYAWGVIDRELQKLRLQKIISNADMEGAKDLFAKILPRASARPIVSGKRDPLAKYRGLIGDKI